MTEKERLNLTVRNDFRSKAAILAEQRRRSISALFEDLIDEEWQRTAHTADGEPRYRLHEPTRLSVTTEAIVITDHDGRVIKINREFTQMCGYTLKELRGKKPGDMLQGPATEKDIVRDFRKAIKAVKPFTCTLANYTKERTLYHVHIEMRPLFEGSKHIGFEALERRLD